MRWLYFFQWLIVLLLPIQIQANELQLEHCDADRILLQPWLQVYEDVGGSLTLDEFLQLPAGSSRPMESNYLRRHAGSAALWLQFRIDNQADAECQLWLFPGASRARDMRLYRYTGDGWQRAVAGPNWPLEQWESPLRLPSFGLILPPGQSTGFVLRMGDNPAAAMQPMLLSSAAQAHLRNVENSVDGVVFGIVGLLVVLSLAIGATYRFPLLFAHAASVLFYILYVALDVGYGFVYLWPDSPHQDRLMIILLHTSLCVAVIEYLRQLLRVDRLPAWVGRLVNGWLGLLMLLVVLQVYFSAEVLMPIWVDWTVHIVMTLLALLITGVGLRRRLRYDWFCYLVLGLLIAQTVATLGFALQWWELSPFEYSWYSVSTLPGALLLLYTLVSQVRKGRHRERQALLDIEQLKQSETERLEHTVAVRTSQLRDALSAQGQLLARISHDLRTPMQGLLQVARQLDERAGLELHARDIEQLASLQLELIDELLEFSRSELQQMELLMAPGYLYGFLREIEEVGRFLSRRNGNRFDCRLASDLPLLVNTDFRRLRQVLVNLLGNAAKFTSNGRIELSVERGVASDAREVMLDFAVEDSGIGIPSDEVARLTDPYWRASNTDQHEGTGLGLYFVQQMLERFGSRLQVGHSDLGGSLFRFSLQLELAEEQELEAIVEERYLPSISGDSRRILVVDDAEISRESLYELLTGYGHEVATCSSVAEARQWLAEAQPDLVISDQYMPGEGGWTLLAHIRERWLDLPVILHSASPPHPPECYSHLAFSASVLKPARSDRLLRLINETLPRVLEPVE